VVLTAAHCVATSNSTPAFAIGESVIVGSTQQGSVTAGAQERQIISAVIVHPLWDGIVENGYDFALFQIESVTEPGLVPVPLNYDACIPSDGELVTTAGFGRTSEGGLPSAELLEVSLPVVPNNVCQEQNRKDPDFSSVVIGEVMLCAGFPAGGKDSCQGTSSSWRCNWYTRFPFPPLS
jgi:secreted trypsin-like serine protease